MGSGEREHGLRWPTELQKQRNQRNRKNSGNTDFAHSRELSERPEFHQAPCEPPKGNGKGSALKLLNKLASGPASLSTVAHQDLKPGAHGKNPRAMARSWKKTSHVCIFRGKPEHRRDFSLSLLFPALFNAFLFLYCKIKAVATVGKIWHRRRT